MSQFTAGFELIQNVIRLKWIPEILESIGTEQVSFTQILESIPYLSSMELTRKLKVLQERGIIDKDEQTSTYYLCPLGADLLHIFMHLQALHQRYQLT